MSAARNPEVSLQQYVDAQIQGIHSHVERQLNTQSQQVVDATAVLSARIEGFYATRDQIMTSLRASLEVGDRLQVERARVGEVRTADLAAHVEQIFAEKDRATEMASQEREKAAVALRVTLERAIGEADNHLREHVVLQINQIRIALDAAELLEKERIDVLDARVTSLDAQIDRRIGSVQGELQAAMLAAREAVSKSETATDKRLEGMNEIRGQLSDQATTFMRADVAEARYKELENRIAAMELHQAGDRGGREIEIRQVDVAQRESANAMQGVAVRVATGALILGLIGTVITLVAKLHG